MMFTLPTSIGQDRQSLKKGFDPVGPILVRMEILKPTTAAELERFNNRMEELFDLSSREQRNTQQGTCSCPTRYLAVLEHFGLHMRGTNDFIAVFPRKA